MKINREQLIELLVQKTDLPQEQAEEQLAELIREIHKAADQGERFQIEKFGTFLMRKGELTFEAADELQTEINNKYAGMQPIELIGAYKESEKASDPALETPEDKSKTTAADDTAEEYKETETWPEDEDIWGWEEQVAEEKREQEQVESEDSVTDDQDSGQEKDTDKESGAKQTIKFDADPDQEEQTDSPEEPEGEPVEAEEEQDGNELQEDETESTPQKKSAPALSTARGRDRKRRGSSTSVIMIGAAVVIVIAIAMWLAYDMGALSSKGTSSSSDSDSQAASVARQNESSNPANDDSESAGSDQEATEAGEQSVQGTRQESQQAGSEEAANDSEPETTNEVANSGDDQAVNSVYGLKGEVNENANDGYTIVVHSIRSQEKARGIYNNLRQEGYRSILVSAIVDGNEYWRIGLGQFKTIEDAQQTAKQLPEPFSNNFFIKRIR